MRTTRLRRALATAAIPVLMTATAGGCGNDDAADSPDPTDEAAADADPTEDDPDEPADDDADAAPEDEPAEDDATDDEPDAAGGGSDSGAACADMIQAREMVNDIQALFDAGDMDAVASGFHNAREKLNAADVPEDIQADWQLATDLVETFVAAIEDAGGDVEEAMATLFVELDLDEVAEQEAAEDRVHDYLADECGVDLPVVRD
ncbi:hypothetical protein [Phytoactinopolyspora mesophila]|uniref:Lipoprotein n=1 Tax=Phytoactinopolyspora mesophila TaxID=2650750 RepID=A0A7K3M2I9_9ACTN|nr:hypothetical protein [Phytoactinopolyspora mesophila]NDL57496.1 hypothetical protein [Phytoactinopolyspora mesophila]